MKLNNIKFLEWITGSNKIIPVDFRFEDGIVSFLMKFKFDILITQLVTLATHGFLFSVPFLVTNLFITKDYFWFWLVFGFSFLDLILFLILGGKNPYTKEKSILSVVTLGVKYIMNQSQTKLHEFSTGEAISQLERGSSGVMQVIESIRRGLFIPFAKTILIISIFFFVGFDSGIICTLWITFNIICSVLITSYCNKYIRPLINESQNSENQNIVESMTQLVFIRSVYFADQKLKQTIDSSMQVHKYTYVLWRFWNILLSCYFAISLGIMLLFGLYLINKLGFNNAVLPGILINIFLFNNESYQFGLEILNFQKAYKNLSEYFDYMKKFES
jgi:ABC-type multidrug transport system fused ATPase/permease subunit